jgi:hypothetical protein
MKDGLGEGRAFRRLSSVAVGLHVLSEHVF